MPLGDLLAGWGCKAERNHYAWTCRFFSHPGPCVGGKTCALSCLGMQPGLSHPPEEIRARFKVLALRVHPDKETHPRAEEAFVVVRAAYERLSAA